jgi:hypothetical protein
MPAPFETAFGLLRVAGICRAPEELSVSKDAADAVHFFIQNPTALQLKTDKLTHCFVMGIL